MLSNPNSASEQRPPGTPQESPVTISAQNHVAARQEMAANEQQNDSSATAGADANTVERKKAELSSALANEGVGSAPVNSLLHRIKNSAGDNHRQVDPPEVVPSSLRPGPLKRVAGRLLGQLVHNLRNLSGDPRPEPAPEPVPAPPAPLPIEQPDQRAVPVPDSETETPVTINAPRPPEPPLIPVPVIGENLGPDETQNNPQDSPVLPPPGPLDWPPFKYEPLDSEPQKTEAEYAREMAQRAEADAAAAAAATREAEAEAVARREQDWAPKYISSQAGNSDVSPQSLPPKAVMLEPMKMDEPGIPIHGPQVYFGSRLNPDPPKKGRNPAEIGQGILEAHSQDVAMERLIENIRQEMAAVHEFSARFRNQSGEINQEGLQDYLRLFSEEMAHGKYTKEDERALRFLTFLSKSLVNPNNNSDYRSGTGLPCRPPITGSARGDIIVAYCNAISNRLSPASGVEHEVWEVIKQKYPQTEWETAYSKEGDQIRARQMKDRGLGLSTERSQRVIAYARQLISREFDELTLSRVNENNRVEVAAAYGLADVGALDKFEQNILNASDNLNNLARATGFSQESVLSRQAEQLAWSSGYNASDIEKWQRIVRNGRALKKRLEERNTQVVFIQLDEETQNKINELVASLNSRREAKGKILGRQRYDKNDLVDRKKVLDAEKKSKIDKEKSTPAIIDPTKMSNFETIDDQNMRAREKMEEKLRALRDTYPKIQTFADLPDEVKTQVINDLKTSSPGFSGLRDDSPLYDMAERYWSESSPDGVSTYVEAKRRSLENAAKRQERTRQIINRRKLWF